MVSVLPHLNASLNGVSLILITAAFIAIKGGNRDLHIKLMISALAVSAVFLASYLIYHANVGHTPFLGEGGIRTVYFSILFTHIGFAVISFVMIVITVLRAYKKNFLRHKAIAKYTFPIWWFVCASGIVVYVMAFHIYAAA